MMELKNFILGLALILIPPLALAVQPNGLYAAQDVGRSVFYKACQGTKLPYTSCKDQDFSHRISIGYKFNEVNASEISYFSSGQTTLNGLGNFSNGIDDVEWQFSGIWHSVVDIGAETGRLLVFGRYGLVHWEAAEANTSSRLNASGNSLLLGIGAKFYITQDTLIRLQYDLHNIGNSTLRWNGNIGFLSIGLAYQP